MGLSWQAFSSQLFARALQSIPSGAYLWHVSRRPSHSHANRTPHCLAGTHYYGTDGRAHHWYVTLSPCSLGDCSCALHGSESIEIGAQLDHVHTRRLDLLSFGVQHLGPRTKDVCLRSTHSASPSLCYNQERQACHGQECPR